MIKNAPSIYRLGAGSSGLQPGGSITGDEDFYQIENNKFYTFENLNPARTTINFYILGGSDEVIDLQIYVYSNPAATINVFRDVGNGLLILLGHTTNTTISSNTINFVQVCSNSYSVNQVDDLNTSPNYAYLGRLVGVQPICYIPEVGMYYTSVDYGGTYWNYDNIKNYIVPTLENGWRLPLKSDAMAINDATSPQGLLGKKLAATSWGGTDDYGYKAEQTGFYDDSSGTPYQESTYYYMMLDSYNTSTLRLGIARIRTDLNWTVNDKKALSGNTAERVRLPVRFCKSA